MARWLVTQGDRQFSAQDLNELKRLAAEGKLGPGDMVQPPGASDWLYAIELPELQGLFARATGHNDDDDDLTVRRGLPQGPLIAILLVVLLAVGYGMYYFGVRVPSQTDLTFDLGLTELQITTDAAQIRSAPDMNAGAITSLPKDSRIQMVAKRGDFYHVRASSGSPEGWLHINDVVAGYQFKDARTREDYDPIYNPDRYVAVENSSWMKIPSEDEDDTEEITVFQLFLTNRSKFEMTDIVLLATIKDDNDRILENLEIPIEGTIPPYSSAMTGTLAPPEDAPEGEAGRSMLDQLFNDLSKRDPDLTLRWSAGIEARMSAANYKTANIDLLELRAIPRKIE